MNTLIKKMVSKTVSDTIKKLVIYMLVLSILAILPTILLTYFTDRNQANENGYNIAVNVSKSVADYLVDKDVDKFLTTADADKSEAYKVVNDYLIQIKKNFGIHYLYVYTIDEVAGEITYIFNPVDKYDQASVRKLGSKVAVGSFYETETAALNGFVLHQPTYENNQFGTVVLGIAPVKNADNQVVALVGSEYLLTEVLTDVTTRTLLTSLYCFVAILVFVALVALFVYLKIVKPTVSMTGELKELSDGLIHHKNHSEKGHTFDEDETASETLGGVTAVAVGEKQSEEEKHLSQPKTNKKKDGKKALQNLLKISMDSAAAIAKDIQAAANEEKE